ASAVCSAAYVCASGSPSITTRNGLPPVETGCGAGTMVGQVRSLAIGLAPGTPHCVPAGGYQVAVRELNEDRVHPPTADQNSAPLSLALWEPGAPPPHVVIRARHRSPPYRDEGATILNLPPFFDPDA